MEDKHEQVMALIDKLGEGMNKQAWIDLLSNISSDCDIRREAAEQELEDEDQ